MSQVRPTAGGAGPISGISQFQMEPVEPGKPLEIRVEGDYAAAFCECEGREIRIRPKPIGRALIRSECAKPAVDVARFGEEVNNGKREKLAVNVPGFPRTERVGKDASAAAQAQEAEHGYAAEGDPGSGLFVPIPFGSRVMHVSFIHQGKPDVDVWQVNPGVACEVGCGLLHQEWLGVAYWSAHA